MSSDFKSTFFGIKFKSFPVPIEIYKTEAQFFHSRCSIRFVLIFATEFP